MRWVILVSMLVALSGCGDGLTEDQRAQKECEDGVSAYWISKDFVLDRLKAPKTAEFPGSRDAGVKTNYLGECTHEVWAYVDAQNAYGALVRTQYYAKVKNQKGSENWSLIDIQM